MKNKSKKNRRSFIKSIIRAVSIVMILVAVLLVVYTLDSKKFNRGRVTYNDEYTMHVLYLVMDEETVPKDITIDKVFDPDYSEYPEGILTTSSSVIPLTKKGEYLYGDLNLFTNPKLLENETDYVFTMKNNNGEVIDGCEYNKKTNTIKVPISYFEENKQAPIQVEIQTLMKESEITNLPTEINLKKFVTSKKTIKSDALSGKIVVNNLKFGPGKLKKENIHIYINNSEVEINKDIFDVDENSISINVPALQINSLDIKVDYSLIGVSAIGDHRVNNFNEFRSIKVNGPINKGINESIGVSLSLGTSIEYCDDYDVCTNIGTGTDGYAPSLANWFYTYFPYNDVYQGQHYDYATYKPTGAVPYYAYRVRLADIISQLASGLSKDPNFVLDSSGNSEWLAFYCMHHTEPGANPTAPDVGSDNVFNFDARVVYKDANSIVLYFYPQNKHNTQEAFAYLRFNWDTPVQHEYGLQVKKIVSESMIPVENLKITAYNTLNTSETHVAYTNSNGIATFDNLTQNGKYKFYEDCSQTNIKFGTCTGTFAACDVQCSHGSSNPVPSGDGKTPVEKVNGSYPSADIVEMSNAKVHHAGLAVKKTDDNGTPVQNLPITIYNKNNSSDTHTVNTNSSGIATFNDVTLNASYYVYETCNSTVTVGSRSGTLEQLDIDCTYDSSHPYKGSDGSSGVPAITDYDGSSSTGLTLLSDARYRYCTVVRKVKGPNKVGEQGAQFVLRLTPNTCRNYPDGTVIRGQSGSDGYTVFNGLGYCEGRTANVEITDSQHVASLIGSAVRQVSLVRTTIKVNKSGGLDYKGRHYNNGETIVVSDGDFNSLSSYLIETCPTGNPTVFEDKGYVLLWTKYNNSVRNNNNGTVMPNVTFRVYNSQNSPIKVKTTKENYTDIEGTTKSCYVWTDNEGLTTTADLVSDSSGQVCIVNLPSAAQYTVTEVGTNYYFNESINLTSTEKFSDFSSKKVTNYPYLIDWVKKEYKNNKTTNNDQLLKDTTFTVVDSSNRTIKSKPNKETVYDKNGVSKSCYVVDVDTPINNTNQYYVSDNSGYVCIVGLTKNMTYTITESTPPTYYAFSNNKSFTESSKLVFSDANTKTFNNCPTEVQITKTTTELSSASADYKALVKDELKKLTFNIYDSEDHLLFFTYNSTSKHYEYTTALNALTGNVFIGAPELRLNDDLKIIVDYLPEGNYKLREVVSVSCASNGAAANGSNCSCTNNTTNSGGTTEESACSNMGYASVPDINFTVTKNNNGDSATCDKADNSTKVSITNKPTKVSFTKRDMYGYFNSDETVKFENQEEIEAFDNITFRVRKKSTVTQGGTSSDADSNFEWFYKTANGQYRYDVLKRCSSEGQRVAGYTCTRNLHTVNGSLTIKHLCKCEEYLIEEYEVPEGTVFVLPKAENNTCDAGYLKVDKGGKIECHPNKAIKICDCDDSDPESSPPVLIDNLATKQIFIKKDLKYNTIITDQNTTFEVFLTTEAAAAAGRKCNPYNTTSKANDCIQMYFTSRTTDPDEADGSYSYKLYKDATSSGTKVKELHVDPRTGKLILRYLPSYVDREYVLYETKAPTGYVLPKDENSVTRFKVVNDTIHVEISNVPNKPSKVIIGKYDADTGNLIPGFKFRVYKVNNYDPNLSPMMQSLSDALWFKTIRDGSYEYRDKADTDLVTTCTNKSGAPCSNIGSSLVADEFSNKPMGDNRVTIHEGEALIQYIDTGSYYVIEEVEAPKGYKLPEKESDRYTLFYVSEDDNTPKITKIYNTETYFTFYKYNEYNQLKDGATFKLQKLNNDKVYEDVPLEDVSTDDAKIYKVSSTSTNYEMTTINGQATIYRLTEGQYRVIEIKAPAGYELPKKTQNVVTFLVDKNGSTFGSNIIANKKNTSRKYDVPVSEAEVVINIQTGQVVVKYGLIIAGILGLIGLLIFIRKKISK